MPNLQGSKSDPDNYRAITVLCVIARLLEKLIHEQLFSYFNDYLYKKQSGFRPKYLTQTALLNTSNQWLLNIDKGDYNLAVFLDLRKAFDTVNHNLLSKKLKFYGIQGIGLDIVMSSGVTVAPHLLTNCSIFRIVWLN